VYRRARALRTVEREAESERGEASRRPARAREEAFRASQQLMTAARRAKLSGWRLFRPLAREIEVARARVYPWEDLAPGRRGVALALRDSSLGES